MPRYAPLPGSPDEVRARQDAASADLLEHKDAAEAAKRAAQEARVEYELSVYRAAQVMPQVQVMKLCGFEARQSLANILAAVRVRSAAAE